MTKINSTKPQIPEFIKEKDDSSSSKTSKSKLDTLSRALLRMGKRIKSISLFDRKIVVAKVKSFFPSKTAATSKSTTKDNSAADNKDIAKNDKMLQKEALGNPTKDKSDNSPTSEITN
ncbi:MAG: hypothetical protein KAG14_05115, partial [Mycoplasmataceae bacterium]|nr:hypothetical protein [Mycoplasmataceae bacterium]